VRFEGELESGDGVGELILVDEGLGEEVGGWERGGVEFEGLAEGGLSGGKVALGEVDGRFDDFCW